MSERKKRKKEKKKKRRKEGQVDRKVGERGTDFIRYSSLSLPGAHRFLRACAPPSCVSSILIKLVRLSWPAIFIIIIITAASECESYIFINVSFFFFLKRKEETFIWSSEYQRCIDDDDESQIRSIASRMIIPSGAPVSLGKIDLSSAFSYYAAHF